MHTQNKNHGTNYYKVSVIHDIWLVEVGLGAVVYSMKHKFLDIKSAYVANVIYGLCNFDYTPVLLYMKN